MELTHKINRVLMLVAIAGSLAIGSLSAALFGIGTSPGDPALVANPHAGMEIALNLTGINGESTISGHENEIEILSWS